MRNQTLNYIVAGLAATALGIAAPAMAASTAKPAKHKLVKAKRTTAKK